MGYYVHLELHDAKNNHSKYYTMVAVYSSIYKFWGRCGTKGSSSSESTPGGDKAQARLKNYTYSKMRKGYVVETEGSITEPPLSSLKVVDDTVDYAFEKIQLDSRKIYMNAISAVEQNLINDSVIKIDQWSTWAAGWEWRSEFKEKIHSHAISSYDKTKDSALIFLPYQAALSLSKDRRVNLIDSNVSASEILLETALSLWTPNDKLSETTDMKTAFQLAQNLVM